MSQQARIRFDRGSLRLDAPRSARLPSYFVWDARVHAWRTEAMRYPRVREDAAAYRVSLDDEAGRFFDCPPLCPALPRLRPDQKAALEAWERAGCRGVVVKPTGTGKTEIALAAIARCQVPALVVVPLRDLMYQWQRRIRLGLGFDPGVLGDGRHEVWPITVTTYDSAYIHMKEVGNRYRLIVYDEAHHLPAPTLRAHRRKLAITQRSAEKLRVVEDILRLHPGDPCVIFTASNRMALEVSARFLIPALTAHSDKKERSAILDLFAAGTLRALVACQVLNEGWDAPAVKVGVVLGGEGGTKEAVQRLGRLLRRTQAYGVDFARFLSGLAGVRGWTMSAEIALRKGRRPAVFTLSDEDGLRSRVAAPSLFDSKLEEALARKFGAKRDGWRIAREALILESGEALVVPDFLFTHDDGTEVALEIVGYWAPEYVAEKFSKLARTAGGWGSPDGAHGSPWYGVGGRREGPSRSTSGPLSERTPSDRARRTA